VQETPQIVITIRLQWAVPIKEAIHMLIFIDKKQLH